MKGYKIVKIANKEKGNSFLRLVDFQEIVDQDQELEWYEDVSPFFMEIQKERDCPNYRKSCVYNFINDNKDPDFNAGFIEDENLIIIRIHNNYEESIIKLKEMADKLNANLYL